MRFIPRYGRLHLGLVACLAFTLGRMWAMQYEEQRIIRVIAPMIMAWAQDQIDDTARSATAMRDLPNESLEERRLMRHTYYKNAMELIEQEMNRHSD